MSLSDEYREQFAWRAWPRLFGALPDLTDRSVLDLGCAIGDQTKELVARGARVIGFDGNEELLETARGRQLARAEFHRADLRSLPDEAPLADGIWSSFSAAYFVDLVEVLHAWQRRVRPGGWIALVEIDDLFAHEPVSARTRELLDGYVEDSLSERRYDFRMGRKLPRLLEEAGCDVSCALTASDRELAFDGPAEPAVLDAWARRFERMHLLRAFCGEHFESVRAEFLACLARADHVSRATVRLALAFTRG